MTMSDEIGCPSCGRITPVAPYCTHCGGVIPEGAARPRGLDRQELEERIRQRRGGEPFRRGAEREPPGAAFVPEPWDELARREPIGGEEPAGGHVDHFVEPAEVGRPSGWPSADQRWTPEPAAVERDPSPTPVGGLPVGAAAEPDPGYRQPAYVPSRDEARNDPGAPDEGGYLPGYDDGETGGPGGYPPDYRYAEGGDEPPRRSGIVPVLGLVVLGVAALLGGAALFAFMNAGPGTAETSPTPSVAASASVEPSSSAAASGSPAGSESAAPSGSSAPSTGPDNFSATAQPCATSKMSFSGCAEDGSTINGTQVWVWLGFKQGQSTDVLGVTIVDHASGSSVGDGSLELSKLSGCEPGKTCSGYITMTFTSLTPGAYDITVTRNGTSVATSAFTVAG